MGIKSIGLVASTLVLSTSLNAATLNFVSGSSTKVESISGLIYDGNSYTGTFNLGDNYFTVRNGLAVGEFSLVADLTFANSLADQVLTALSDTYTTSDTSDSWYIVTNDHPTLNDVYDVISDDDQSNSIDIKAAYHSDTGGFSYVNSNRPIMSFSQDVSTVPVPAAAWLFGSGLLGLIGIARRKTNA